MIRSTERVALPENDAAMGNFGVSQVSEGESWVTCGEGVRSGEREGDINRVLLAKIAAD